MKKIIAILAIILMPITAGAALVVNNSTMAEMESIVERGSYFLQMDDIKIVIVDIDFSMVGKKYDKNKTKAFVTSVNPHIYRIYVNPFYNWGGFDEKVRTICHELVHIKQMKDGRLTILDNKGNVDFIGRKYNVRTKEYSEQLHEKEAIMMSGRFWKKIYERLTRNQKQELPF